MTKYPKVVKRTVLDLDLTEIKTYIFDWAGDVSESLAYIEEVLPKEIRNYKLGVAFVYGYDSPNGFVRGTDIFMYREPEKRFTMFDSWTIENGKYIPREKGTMCNAENDILNKEDELRQLLLIEYDDTYHYTRKWPKIPFRYEKRIREYPWGLFVEDCREEDYRGGLQCIGFQNPPEHIHEESVEIFVPIAGDFSINGNTISDFSILKAGEKQKLEGKGIIYSLVIGDPDLKDVKNP